MSNKLINQHKRMAMGDKPNTKKFANGGSVPRGLPTSPITDSKRANGIPEMKRGGKSCG